MSDDMGGVATGGKHLHIRGENATTHGVQSNSRETPPHTWRKLRHTVLRHANAGNTSTYVEKIHALGQRDCRR